MSAPIVLVHGAWHGPWAWDRVGEELDRRGLAWEAVELPFTGFPDDERAAREAIERAGEGAVVCGHSYGGFVISAAARGTSAGHLVYLCAFMVDEDENPWQRFFDPPSPLVAATKVEGDRSVLDPELAPAALYGDSDEATIAEILPRLRSLPASGPAIDHSAPAWRTIPSTYVVAAADQAILVPFQELMARHAGEVVRWDCDHSPFLTRPAELAELLAERASR
jgi:pimeloyl-ACP methyl ester carboxylesterase